MPAHILPVAGRLVLTHNLPIRGELAKIIVAFPAAFHGLEGRRPSLLQRRPGFLIRGKHRPHAASPVTIHANTCFALLLGTVMVGEGDALETKEARLVAKHAGVQAVSVSIKNACLGIYSVVRQKLGEEEPTLLARVNIHYEGFRRLPQRLNERFNCAHRREYIC